MERETLRTLARPDVDWTNSSRADKAMRRLAKRGLAKPWGRQFPSGKSVGFRLTAPAGEILARFTPTDGPS